MIVSGCLRILEGADFFPEGPEGLLVALAVAVGFCALCSLGVDSLSEEEIDTQVVYHSA